MKFNGYCSNWSGELFVLYCLKSFKLSVISIRSFSANMLNNLSSGNLGGEYDFWSNNFITFPNIYQSRQWYNWNNENTIFDIFDLITYHVWRYYIVSSVMATCWFWKLSLISSIISLSFYRIVNKSSVFRAIQK